jgi:carboxyl-terminal processing protease
MEGPNALSKKEKLNLFLPLILAVALAGGTWLGLNLSQKESHNHFVVGKVDETLKFIEARYLEKEDQKELEDIAIQSILKELDPHSNYISLKNIENVNQSLSGNFEGIGIEFFILEDTIYVVGVIEDGPSALAGVENGDKIIMIDDSLVAGKNIYNNRVVDQLKGPAGSLVNVKVKRQGSPTLKSLDITRGQIPMYSLDVAYMANETTGVIKINRFSGTTFREFMKALQDLVEQQQMQHLVLDLRNNPGGYLDAATRILDQIFSTRELLVYTEGRSHKRKEYKSMGKNSFEIGKVVILINENSASASEIMAGAIQDNDRGLIVGRRSFGKGLVQEQYTLSDGSALRLTVARYFTPSGRYIQKPYDGSEGDYEDDMMHRLESGEFYNQDSIHHSDTTVYKTTSGRIVYGGGGIAPDIFIPIDSNRLNTSFILVNRNLRRYLFKNIFYQKSDILEKHPDFESFYSSYKITDATIDALIAFTSEAENIEIDSKIEQFRVELKNNIKAQIADQLYTSDGMYRILFDQDAMVQKALKEINRGKKATQKTASNK